MDHQSFIEQCLSKTMDLANGSKFFVYSYKKISYRDIYSCNLCGIMEINDLCLHEKSVLHRELSKLDKVPYKYWMADCIINNKGVNCLDTATTNFTPTFSDLDEASYIKNDEIEKSKNNPKSKPIPRCYRTISVSSDSDQDTNEDPEDLTRLISIDVCRKNSADCRTFLSMCRQLTSLEEFLDEKLKNGIKDLFLKSIELERTALGSSNDLLTFETLEFLFTIKTSISKQLDTLPVRFLSIVNVFYDDMLHFTEQYAAACNKEKKIKRMREKLLQNNGKKGMKNMNF